MKLVPHNDPILKIEIPAFDLFKPPTDPHELAHQMISFMYENNGIGLSANQVGLLYRVFVMSGGDQGDFVCFNPRIIDVSAESHYMEEGCLSYPGLVVKIKRPKSIKVRFQLPDGDITTEKFAGLSARVFMHELDHLNGVVHLTRANLYHKQQAMKRWKKFKKAA